MPEHDHGPAGMTALGTRCRIQQRQKGRQGWPSMSAKQI